MAGTGTELSAQDLRSAYGLFPTGVTALCGMRLGAPVGMAVSSFTSVSLDPPLVSVCIDAKSETWPELATLPHLGLSVLAAEHDAVCRSLARREGDRFAGLDYEMSERGAVFIERASLWIECSVEKIMTAGDHLIVVMRIDELWSYPDVAPLLFHRGTLRGLRT